ncbi:MAG: SHOCT domain-containing protein [Desulfitobacterium hafniense]|nr:SHOCT domain-containing protein [Desulfitobacterium hafniense]
MMWGYGPWTNGSFGGGYWWMGLLGMAVQMLFWVGLIVLGVYLFRRVGNNGRVSFNGGNEALEILKERYARGEIDTEEFSRRKEDLLR